MNVTCDVAIIGAGYVGLPLAQTFAEAGQRVLARRRRARDRRGDQPRARATSRTSPPSELGAARRGRARSRATLDYEQLSRRRGDPDRAADAADASSASPTSSYVEARRARDRRRCSRPGQLVVLESTTYPGTTREVVAPILEQGSGLDGRHGLPPRDVARARRPGAHRLDDEDDAEGRRRPHPRLHRGGRGASTAARSTPCTRSRRPSRPS